MQPLRGVPPHRLVVHGSLLGSSFDDCNFVPVVKLRAPSLAEILAGSKNSRARKHEVDVTVITHNKDTIGYRAKM
jgi:hypothetical protein